MKVSPQKLGRILIQGLVFIFILIEELYNFRTTLIKTAYLNDMSWDEEMVRHALFLYRSGRFPLTSWFPFLNLGNPEYLHYPSLGAMLTALVGWFIGPDNAFRIISYLLLSIWPFVIYLSFRIFGANWQSATASSLVAWLISGINAIGYQPTCYYWNGAGLWAQLWASETLPFALAFSYRWIREEKYLFLAVMFSAATFAFHFETAYLLVLGVLIFPFLEFNQIIRRFSRTGVLLALIALSTAWVTLPLLKYKNFTAINVFLYNTTSMKGYGARNTIYWLMTGQLLDYGRSPVLTLLLGFGALMAYANRKKFAYLKVFLALSFAYLILSFGPSTTSAFYLIPGSHDIFFRRFIAGFDLEAIYLIGYGINCIFQYARLFGRELFKKLNFPEKFASLGIYATLALVTLFLGFYLQPAFVTFTTLSEENHAQLMRSLAYTEKYVGDLNQILTYIRLHSPDRVYAGLESSWGLSFKLGAVSVNRVLEKYNFDQVGATVATFSLMSEPEAYFNENNNADFVIFAVNYLVLPKQMSLPIKASFIMNRGYFSLWKVSGVNYFQPVNVVGQLFANRFNLGYRSVGFLNSKLGLYDETLLVQWDKRGNEKVNYGQVSHSPGSVLSERADLSLSEASAKVAFTKKGYLMLSVSYDPGWLATIDSKPAKISMLAPSLLGVQVSPGIHRVKFYYPGYAYYPELFAILAISLALAKLISVRQFKRYLRFL